jgi:hypothetical protein
MERITLKNRDLIPTLNALLALQAHLRPGLLAFRVGYAVSALKPPAVQIQEQRTKLIDVAALKREDGSHVTETLPSGITITKYATPEAGREFEERERELFSGTTEVVTPVFTLEDLEKIERDRTTPPDGTPPIQYDALVPLLRVPMPAAPSTTDAGSSESAPTPAATPEPAPPNF